MDLVFTVGMVVLLAGSGLETLLYFFATPVLARAAFFPLGEISIDIGRVGQELLSGRQAAALLAEGLPREAMGYRSAPAAPVAIPESIVARLGVSPVEESDSQFLYGVPARDELVLRLPFKFFGSRTYGLVRTRLAFDGHKVVLKSHYLPVPSLSYGLASVFLLVAAAVSGQGFQALFFLGALLFALVFTGVISWLRLRGPRQALRARIEGRLRALG